MDWKGEVKEKLAWANERVRPEHIRRRAGLVLAAGLVLYVLWPWLPVAGTPVRRTMVVYGFSILGQVMNDAVFPAFQDQWLAEHGEEVEFISAFAGSGTITNQILLGAPAEIAILSTELDGLRLVQGGVLPGTTWRALPYAGVLNRTPFIILVRSGNPLQIQDFGDLARPGVQLIHPDPLTSGGAQWAILAEYGAALHTASDPVYAYDLLLGIWRNVVAQAPSASAARTQFNNGFGDALITYEQDPLKDKLRGQLSGEMIYPMSTILSEHTVVVLQKNIRQEDQDLVTAFLEFLWSEQGQEIFTRHGFRSVDERLNAGLDYFPAIPAAFTVEDLGGWPVARQQIIVDVWETGVLPRLGK